MLGIASDVNYIIVSTKTKKN